MELVSIQYSNATRRYQQIKEIFKKKATSIYESGRFHNGKYSVQLKEWLSDFKHYPYVILTSSGTASLYVMASYFKQYYDNVLTTPYTFKATHNAFKRAGFKVNYTTLDPNTLNGRWDTSELIDGNHFHCLVGIFGAQPTFKNDVSCSIMDGCQNWIRNQDNLSTAISFDPTKTIASNGNGGAILTEDCNLFEYSNKFISHGSDVSGLNLRMTELECAYVLSQIDFLDNWMIIREQILDEYKKAFGSYLIYPDRDDLKALQEHDCQKAVLRINNPEKVSKELLEGFGIMSKVLYPEQEIINNTLSIPLYPELTTKEINRIISSISAFL